MGSSGLRHSAEALAQSRSTPQRALPCLEKGRLRHASLTLKRVAQFRRAPSFWLFRRLKTKRLCWRLGLRNTPQTRILRQKLGGPMHEARRTMCRRSCLSCLLQHIVERASESQSAKEAEGKRCTRCAERTLLRNPLVLKREQRNKHTAVECPDAQSLTGCEGGEVPRENDANCRVLITLYLLPTRTKSPRKL